jgi:hypothetical protein
MFRFAFAAVLLGAVASLVCHGQQPARAPQTPAPQVFKGQIKDVKGTEGTLTLAQKGGKRDTDRTFQVQTARIVDQSKSELKIGSLRPGDWVEVEMAPDGRTVQEIRVLPPPKER